MPPSPKPDPAEKLKQAEAAEKRLIALARVFGQINFEVDFENDRVSWSGSENLGYNRDLDGQSIDDWFDLVHPEDRPRIEAPWAKVPTENAPLYRELRLRQLDGSFRRYDMRGLPIEIKRGRIATFVGVLDDLTERRPGANLAAERDSLARSNHALQELAYVASHDLQEPIRTIIAFVERLNEDHRKALDNDGRKYLDFIGDGARRLQHLTNDLLTYSRLASGETDIRPVSLQDIARDAMANLYAALEASKAEVRIDPLPSVPGERTRLLILFQNLLGNALKFCPPDTPPEIQVSAQEMDHLWKITIADNGIGIPSEQHEHIFRIFHRLHRQSAYGGTGMGLAICKKIAERHGGGIWVESAPGEGSRFHFTIQKIAH